MPLRRRYLFVCTNRRPDGNPKGSCAQSGADEIAQALKEALFARGLAKVETRSCASGCLDQCASGPVVLVEPDHFFYGHVTAGDVGEIVDALAQGGRVERLVLGADDLAKG